MICKNSLPVYGLSFHFLSDVLWNTNVLILTLFSLFIFFFCCLCIPELSPSTLSLSPYSSSSGFWLGWEAVVLWTGSSSLRVCSFFPWTLSYPCVPLAHLPCTLRLITTSWQQPTRQLPLLQLLPLSVCSTCCCQTHQPSVSPLIQMTPPLPAQVQLVLQGRIRSSSFSSSASRPEVPWLHHMYVPTSPGFLLPFQTAGCLWNVLTSVTLSVTYVPCLLGHTLYFPELMSPSVKMGITTTSWRSDEACLHSAVSHEHFTIAATGSELWAPKEIT